VPGEDGWLSKAEVNALYYNTVAGEISFATEAGGGDHSVAVARLVGAQAAALGRSRIRMLELGANHCAFARLLIEELWAASGSGKNELTGIDYVAVELSRSSLEEAVRRERGEQLFERLTPGGQGGVVGTMGESGELEIELTLVHSDANAFVRSAAGPFDFVIVNELLDDLPCRAYFSDADGCCFELVSSSRGEDGRWTIRVEAEAADLDGLPPGTVTARSPESVELVARAAELLAPGGMLLVHDDGFAEPWLPLETYADAPPSLPAFAELVFPDGPLPRSFYRVFGNEAKRAVQVTNDVNFAELTAVLEPAGTVIAVPHGNAKINRGGRVQKGDGTFLGELGRLSPGDDLPALLAGLADRQELIRDEFVSEYGDGRASVFLDLIFVKAGPTGT
jgi:hypothetical protein